MSDSEQSTTKKVKYHGEEPDPDPIMLVKTNNKGVVYEDYSCRLQKQNDEGSDEFIILQVTLVGSKVFLYIRWGLVGEDGRWKADRKNTTKEAVIAFRKAFREKTDNGWKNRDNFVPQPGKYYMCEEDANDADDNDDDAADDNGDSEDGDNSGDEPVAKKAKIEFKKPPLDERTKLMLKIILDQNVFADQINKVFKLDPKKVSMEKLTESFFEKAENALLELAKAVKARKQEPVLKELWTAFYRCVRHQNHGVLPSKAINHPESLLHEKRDMMLALYDISCIHNFLQQVLEEDQVEELDAEEQYKLLGCDLRLLDKEAEEYQLVREYASSCKNSRQGTLLDVWRINRKDEKNRDEENPKFDYRKLLWCGVNIARVAAILKAGFRITQFSGGPLGKGLYFTPEHAKCSWNVGVHWGTYEKEKNVGFMFLAEVALGRMKYVKMGNISLVQPPEGYNSVAAKGRVEPDSSQDKIRFYNGKRVIVPVGAPVPQKEFESSGFHSSSYVLYDEGLVRLRYLVKVSFA